MLHAPLQDAFCHRLTATARRRPLLWREESESKSVCSCCKHLGGGARHRCKYGETPHTESHSTAPVFAAVSKAVSGRRAGVLHGQGTVLPAAKPLGGDNGLPMVAYGSLLVPFGGTADGSSTSQPAKQTTWISHRRLPPSDPGPSGQRYPSGWGSVCGTHGPSGS